MNNNNKKGGSGWGRERGGHQAEGEDTQEGKITMMFGKSHKIFIFLMYPKLHIYSLNEFKTLGS